MEISNDDYDKGPETPGPDMQSSRAEAAGFDFLEDDRELIQSLVNESTYAGRRLSTNVQVPGEYDHILSARSLFMTNSTSREYSSSRIPRVLGNLPPPDWPHPGNHQARLPPPLP